MMTRIHHVMTPMRNQLSNNRGAVVLTMTIITALLAAIASYAALQVSIAYARQGRFFINHTPCRYATEAGVVWAQEQLWNNAAFCSAVGLNAAGTTAPELTVNGVAVDVVVTGCGAGNIHTVTARARY